MGVEAAWRVGDWEMLAEFVQNAEEGKLVLDAQDQWEVKLGHLLCASQQRCSFQLDMASPFRFDQQLGSSFAYQMAMQIH